ncbi:hypothetical protein NLX83_16395 [Allokutzneria sp. A3M-2-11 16]|uniref:endonuclease domain-containing protein n=1 Tax=Allokutzneria sp. A3M-2-11 16 TaxID=2962043 RepID=UPI0020B6B1EC|nr:hypothetical protein [Allokutzneria sp. A3M-2-11 16]MCP3800846.1 hypothetical protein [Allokutzneria sp. A3M-2-11 16]
MTRTRPALEVELFRGSDAITDGVLTPDVLRTPHFVRLFRDAYAVRGTPITHELRCRAAALVLPEAATLTGVSAATIYGVPLATGDDPVELAAPSEARAHRRPGMRVRNLRIPDEESVPWNGIRLATPLRTAYDLLIGRRSLVERVACTDAWLRSGLVDFEELRRIVVKRHDHGVVVGRQAVELVDPRAESFPESELRVLLNLNELYPVPQLKVCDSNGFIARVDLGFEEEKVAVEYDGAWHGDANQLPRDRERMNRLQAAGWHVVYVTAKWLRSSPRSVAAVVTQTLRERRQTPFRTHSGKKSAPIGR